MVTWAATQDVRGRRLYRFHGNLAPGPFFARRPGYSGILHDLGLKVANYTDEFAVLGVEGMNLGGLAWAVAYGFRPRAVHIRLAQWLHQEAAHTSMPRAKETILPFVVSLLAHQQTLGFIASLDCNVAESGLLDHWSWKQAFGEKMPPAWAGTGLR